jgi:hypothetical protein
MKKITFGATIVALSSFATLANAAVDMDGINTTATLISTPVFGVNQRFTDAAFSGNYNSMVIDDFVASGTNINEVAVAFEETIAGNHTTVTNWHLSIFSSSAAGAASGNMLTGDVANADLASSGGTFTTLTGGTNARGSMDFTGLNIAGLTVGHTYWMGLAPDLAFTPNGQQFILSNTAPAVETGGLLNSVGINPGNGFTGNPHAVNTNAGLFIRTGAAVPEPATMAVLGIGALALIRRRRSRKA